MAKNKNTFEKRRKEMEKKRKADEKRERRHARRGRRNESESAGISPETHEPGAAEISQASL